MLQVKEINLKMILKSLREFKHVYKVDKITVITA